MKKVMLMALVALCSCTKQGEVQNGPIEAKVHGRDYIMTHIVPCDGCNAIWFIYPKDSNQAAPVIINQDIQQGKTTTNQAVIEVP